MNRRTTLLLVVFAMFAGSARAGVEYDFHQTRQSEVRAVPNFDVGGRAVIEGQKSRVDFLSGNGYTPGSYVISTDGSRTLVFVDPVRKSFAEISLGAALASIGSANISVENVKTRAETMPDHPVVAGLPTDHHRLTLTYEVTMRFGTIALRQAVNTTIDKYTTLAFGDISDTFLGANSFRTGNPDIDQMMDLETTKFKGIALRQVLQIVTRNDSPHLPNSALKINDSRKQISDMTITSIRARDVNAELFKVPATYHREDPSIKGEQATPVHVLSMEPAVKQ
jgi:hypothetical protein